MSPSHCPESPKSALVLPDPTLSAFFYRYRTTPQDHWQFEHSFIRYAIGPSRFGLLLLAFPENGHGICAAFLASSQTSLIQSLLVTFPHHAEMNKLIKVSTSRCPWFAFFLDFLADRPLIPGRIPLDIGGTPFQQQVWQALCLIPRGQTRSYADIAQAIGQPRNIRHTASAIADNLIAVAIPCHRVIHQDGSLGAYGWGADRKRLLLASEQVPPSPQVSWLS